MAPLFSKKAYSYTNNVIYTLFSIKIIIIKVNDEDWSGTMFTLTKSPLKTYKTDCIFLSFGYSYCFVEKGGAL